MERGSGWWAQAGILTLAVGLRVWGVSFGLDLAHPERTQVHSLTDERGMVEAVQDGFLQGSLHPGKFLYRGPAGLLLFGAVDASLIAARALVHPAGWRGRMNELAVNPSWLHLVHRCIAAAAGAAAVLVLMRILAREFGRASALCGGLVLAVAYMHVSHSHFGTPDTLWSLTLLLALDRMLLWIRAPSRARAAASGICAGISAATKYFSVLLGAHLVLAHFFARRNDAPGSGHGKLAWALCAVPVGFLLVAPGMFVAWRDFFGTVDHISSTIGSQGTLVSMLDNIRWHATWSLGVGLGEPAFVLGLVGLLVAWRRGAAGRFLVLALLLLVPSLFLTNQRPVRYAMLVLTMLACTSGIALAALLVRVPRRLCPLIVGACLAPSLARSASLDLLLQREDTRAEVLAELDRRAQPPQQVVAIGSQYSLPHGPQRTKRLYLTYGPAATGRPELTLAELSARPPRLVLRDLSAPDWAVPERDGLEEFLRTSYREVLRLESRRGAVELPDPVFGNPTMMVPYAQPWTMSRPGPPFVLYERNE